MSHEFKPSKNQDESFNSDYKQPDLIIIDDKKNPEDKKDEKAEDPVLNPSSPTSSSSYQSIAFLRMICLLGFVVSLLSTLITLFIFALVFFACLFTFFSQLHLKRLIYGLWKLFFNLIIITLTLGLGIFFPRFGLGLLLVYFALSGNAHDPTIWRQIFQKSFKDV